MAALGENLAASQPSRQTAVWHLFEEEPVGSTAGGESELSYF